MANSYFGIQKINAWDNYAMCDAYTYLLGCESYKKVSRKDFDRCNDGLYLAIDTTPSTIKVIVPYGIIGIRKTTTEELQLEWEDMEFYPLPNSCLYTIDFLHIPAKTGFNLLDDSINPATIGIELIRESLSDKNDSFVYLKMKCPTGKLNYAHTALLEHRFKIISFDSKTYTYTYIRMPKMHLNE